MDQRAIVVEAVAGAAVLLSDGSLDESGRPEERMRRAIASELRRSDAVEEVEFKWQSEMPDWPSASSRSRLGGFDLRIAFADAAGVTVAEVSGARGEVLMRWMRSCWMLKLRPRARGHSRSLVGLLHLRGTHNGMERPAGFTNLLDESCISTRELISEGASAWRWLLKGSSKSRPRKLPPYIQTSRSHRHRSLSRVSHTRSDSQASGQTIAWFELDENGWPVAETERPVMQWPHPEPGLDMPGQRDEPFWNVGAAKPPLVENEDLRRTEVPGPHASWNELTWFAAKYGGYGPTYAAVPRRTCERICRSLCEGEDNRSGSESRRPSGLPVLRASPFPSFRPRSRTSQHALYPRTCGGDPLRCRPSTN